jgi:tRNA-specific 2-thiouridylase
MARSLTTGPFNWLAARPADGARLHARIRHRQALQACTIEHAGDALKVCFETPQRAAVAGQFCALYDEQRCLGGGEILSVETLS